MYTLIFILTFIAFVCSVFCFWGMTLTGYSHDDEINPFPLIFLLLGGANLIAGIFGIVYLLG